MVDLIEYGFIKTLETDRQTDYEGHGFTINVYGYLFKTFEGIELARHVFVVNSKQFTSRSRPIEELGAWLEEKNIKKT